VFDDIGRRIFLEQPARENRTPAFCIRRAGRPFVDEQLHERALVGVSFPRRGFLAGAQADDDFAEADGFARFQLDIAGLAVALVQEAEHSNAFRHRRTDLFSLGRYNFVIGRLGLARLFRRKFGFVAATQHVASTQRRQKWQQQQAARQLHAASGLHA
jgi:hypothetical protein